jgi:threonine dehydrogenase-like Zn-dependent dehydrogenase
LSDRQESARVGLGDTVAIFAQGPIGLCASVGARLLGAGLVIAVDSVPNRLEMARRLGADVALNFEEVDVVAEIQRLTRGRGVDVAIEALGTSGTFANALKVTRPGGISPR